MSEVWEDRTIKYELGGKFLEMKPLSLKQLTKALQIVEQAGQQIRQTGAKDPVEFVQQLPAVLVGKFKELAPLLFPEQGLTESWIEEYFDVPKARKVIMDAARINDVMDFLVSLRDRMEPTPPKPESLKA